MINVDVWNVLHDGELIAADGSVPGELKLSVGIAYLCVHLPTDAAHVIITLSGCDRFEYQPYRDPRVSNPSAVAAMRLQFLSAEVADGAVSVECADGGYGGHLALQYLSASAATAEGRPLSQSELECAAERYWSLWEQMHSNQNDTFEPR